MNRGVAGFTGSDSQKTVELRDVRREHPHRTVMSFFPRLTTPRDPDSPAEDVVSFRPAKIFDAQIFNWEKRLLMSQCRTGEETFDAPDS